MLIIAGSSNGRIEDSESFHLGSNPGPATWSLLPQLCYNFIMNDFSKDITIRPEIAADYDAIATVTRVAFGKDGELVAELVNNIRNSPNYIPELSLVAANDGKIVGHIMLSHLDLDDNGTIHRVVTLSPISIKPEMQKKGIGSSLIKTAIKKADALGEPLIMLEGDPNFYLRFGFKPGKEFGISIALPHWAPEAAMILPLSKYSQDIKGKIVYPSYFDKVNQPPSARQQKLIT